MIGFAGCFSCARSETLVQVISNIGNIESAHLSASTSSFRLGRRNPDAMDGKFAKTPGVLGN